MGDALERIDRAATLQRLWAHVPERPDDGCWEVHGLWRDKDGYAIVTAAGSRLRAHRLVLRELLGRPIPTGRLVLHRCDNPPCVRPAHLYLGTASDNARDRVERHRRQHRHAERAVLAGQLTLPTTGPR